MQLVKGSRVPYLSPIAIYQEQKTELSLYESGERGDRRRTEIICTFRSRVGPTGIAQGRRRVTLPNF